MMCKFTVERLQQHLEGLGDETRVTSMNDYNLLEYPEGLRIAMPVIWPAEADGSPRDPFCPFDEQDRARLRQALKLTEQVTDIDVMAGQWHDGIFWLFRPGDLITHILVDLIYGYKSQNNLLFQEFNDRHQVDWSYLEPEHPCEDGGANRGCTFLAQSQHVLVVPAEVMPLLHPGAIFGDC